MEPDIWYRAHSKIDIFPTEKIVACCKSRVKIVYYYLRQIPIKNNYEDRVQSKRQEDEEFQAQL